MAYPQERFISIKSEVIEVVSELLDSFSPDASDEEQFEAHSRALSHYINRVARIGVVANVVGYKGLHDVCVVFQAALRELHNAARLLTPEERELLEEWPMLIMSYLSEPSDTAASQAIINLLQQLNKSNLSSEEEYDEIYNGLIHPKGLQTTLETCVVVEESAPEQIPMPERTDECGNSTAEDFDEDISGSSDLSLTKDPQKSDAMTDEFMPQDAPEYQEEDLIYENQGTLNALKQEVREATEELIMGFESARKNSDLLSVESALSLCADRIEIMAMSVADAGLMGLMDVSLLFQEGLHNLASNITIDTMEDVQIFQSWKEHFIAYLDAPTDESTSVELIEFLRQLPWMSPISDEEAEALQTMLIPEQIELTEAPEDIALTDEQLISDKVEDIKQTLENVEGSLSSEEEWSGEEVKEKEKEIEYIAEDIQESVEDIHSSNAELAQPPIEATDISSLDYDEAWTEAEVSTVSEINNHEQHTPDSVAHSLESTGWAEDEANHQEYSENIHNDDLVQASQSVEVADVISRLDDDEVTTEADVSTASELDDVVLELINLVSMEIEGSRDDMDELLSQAIGTDAALKSLTEYSELLERFAAASESVGLAALSNVIVILENNVTAYANQESEFGETQVEWLKQWPDHVLAYLNNLTDKNAVDALLQYLTSATWALPLAAEQAEEIGAELYSPVIEIEEEIEPRQRVAIDEDVSLQLPDDVNADLLDSLLQELPNHTEEFTQAISKFLEGTANLNDLDVAQRIAHTLKGSANTVGVVGIANLTHHIEDILLVFSKHETIPGTVLADSLMKAADTLEVMSEALLGIGPPPTDSKEVLQEILDWANQIDLNGIPDDETIAPEHATNESPTTTTPTTNIEEASSSQDESTSEVVLRVPAALLDELLRLVGETVILNGQLQERLHNTEEQTRSAQEQNSLFQQLTFELEQLVDIQGIASQHQHGSFNEDFDTLEMDQYNELHTVTRRLVEAATDSQEIAHTIEEYLTDLDGLLVDQGRLHRVSQEVVMQTRMVPVQNVVPRLNRSVRQNARLTDKKVKLEITGSDTLMDSDVLNDLIDPLMHILRNAIDHGIEKEEKRIARDKDATGRIVLDFSRQGDQMVVRCKDDGAGLDYAAIRATAIDRGLIKVDQEISTTELNRLILRQGFSTRTEATQVSGRGIGMDAVYNRVIDMKGSLAIESETGKGCQIELRLPVSFISIHALLVRLRNQVFAVSNRGIEQILYPGAGVLSETEDKITYQIEEDIYEAMYLDALLQLEHDRRHGDRHTRPVLLVREDTGAISAVVVEEVVASQDLVVKQLGQYVPHIHGIEGATILGDGGVAPVMDLPELLRTVNITSGSSDTDSDEAVNSEVHLPCALVVDDSLTARRTLAQFVKDVGYEVRTARDGLEAIEIIDSKKPDILLVDMEMPRMNGLELTHHVRANEATKDMPIIMITSRSTEKHRQQAEVAGVNVYLTKPFSDDELLQHIENQLNFA